MAQYIPVDFALARSNWVYRMFDAHGQCLYVGKSCGTPVMQRLTQHLTTINPTHRKPWAHEVSRVDVAAFDTPDEAAAEEAQMIKRLNPKYNRAGKLPAGTQTLGGLEW
jgi:excinuclease UvrABC nuclease subunit